MMTINTDLGCRVLIGSGDHRGTGKTDREQFACGAALLAAATALRRELREPSTMCAQPTFIEKHGLWSDEQRRQADEIKRRLQAIRSGM